MAYIHGTMHSDNSSFDVVLLALAIFVLGVPVSGMIRRPHRTNSPGRFVRFRPHIDDLVASIAPIVVLQSPERSAQQRAVTGPRHQIILPPTLQAILAPLR
ncbi:hypothetical protein SCLCIDRAFT_26363 [Scleroderma citrinum Foug A]|uniref:Uncharacterized protein n=1 Tax=Scleroderma citrinum Foug A TaxID=1036808 RepID=A0A0C2ZG66_9AGAM|nr:hypothetical protein SCLCIDRAFT_26363 [Scleroderma citrinum Foug A]